MRKILALFIILVAAFLLSPVAKAHFGGIAALKINDKFTVVYPLQNIATNIGDNYLPTDEAPGKFIVNKPIGFEIDLSRLPFPDEVIKQTKFNWDFGDGTKTAGVKVSHTYTKIGSHIATLTMNFGDLSSFGISPDSLQQGPQTTLINVVPNDSYQLPRAIITIDKQAISNPSKDTFTTNFKYKLGPFTLNKSFAFDASSSVNKSAPIASYLWDFGDDTTSTKSKLTHSYAEEYFIREPVLRIVDANGFISDTYATMSKSEKSTQNKDENLLPVVYTAGGIVAVAVLILVIIKRKRKKN